MSDLILKDNYKTNDFLPKIRGIVSLIDENGRIIFKKENMIVKGGRNFILNKVFNPLEAASKDVSFLALGTGSSIVDPDDVALESGVGEFVPVSGGKGYFYKEDEFFLTGTYYKADGETFAEVSLPEEYEENTEYFLDSGLTTKHSSSYGTEKDVYFFLNDEYHPVSEIAGEFYTTGYVPVSLPLDFDETKEYFKKEGEVYTQITFPDNYPNNQYYRKIGDSVELSFTFLSRISGNSISSSIKELGLFLASYREANLSEGDSGTYYLRENGIYERVILPEDFVSGTTYYEKSEPEEMFSRVIFEPINLSPNSHFTLIYTIYF